MKYSERQALGLCRNALAHLLAYAKDLAAHHEHEPCVNPKTCAYSIDLHRRLNYAHSVLELTLDTYSHSINQP